MQLTGCANVEGDVNVNVLVQAGSAFRYRNGPGSATPRLECASRAGAAEAGAREDTMRYLRELVAAIYKTPSVLVEEADLKIQEEASRMLDEIEQLRTIIVRSECRKKTADDRARVSQRSLPLAQTVSPPH